MRDRSRITPRAEAIVNVRTILKKFPVLRDLESQYNLLDAHVELVDDELLQTCTEYSIGEYTGSHYVSIDIRMYATKDGKTSCVGRVARDPTRKCVWWKPSTWGNPLAGESVMKCLERIDGKDVTHVSIVRGTSCYPEYGHVLEVRKFPGKSTYGEWRAPREEAFEVAVTREIETL